MWIFYLFRNFFSPPSFKPVHNSFFGVCIFIPSSTWQCVCLVIIITTRAPRALSISFCSFENIYSSYYKACECNHMEWTILKFIWIFTLYLAFNENYLIIVELEKVCLPKQWAAIRFLLPVFFRLSAFQTWIVVLIQFDTNWYNKLYLHFNATGLVPLYFGLM